MNNWKLRLAGLLLAAASVWYIPWLAYHLNRQALWLSVPFALATVLMAIMTFVTVINHWRNGQPEPHPLPAGNEPAIAIIIPTAGEPPAMVYATAKSVLDQDYPCAAMGVFISDDAHSTPVREMVQRLRAEYPAAHIAYHEPPSRGDPRRRGEAKSGNLNSALEMIQRYSPHVQFIETRDADDLVGVPTFLREAIGQLVAAPEAAFVQTIKESIVAPGDPFGNQEPLFYRKAMLAKHSDNAVFPCGSGMIWRRKALEDIGGFPTWNLVEDLQSGVEALRRGWRGIYLPIVGALGQTAPEDIPNMIKQRGVWALDTMRITFWLDKRGLNLMQNLQFSELGFFYMLSLAVLTFMIVPIITLAFDVYPIITNHVAYIQHFWPYAAAVEFLLVALADGLPYEALWRSRQTWLGMAPVYVKATWLALTNGPHHKPTYKVTRKTHAYAFYWREVLPQIILFLALLGSSIYHVLTHPLLLTADLGSLFWACFFMLGLSRVIRNSWHGTQWSRRLKFWSRARDGGVR
jgi:cellulose synthase (UDP-forming)